MSSGQKEEKSEHCDRLWLLAVRHLPYRNREASQHQYSKNHSLLFAGGRHHAESLRARPDSPGRLLSALRVGRSYREGFQHSVVCHGLKPFKKRILSFFILVPIFLLADLFSQVCQSSFCPLLPLSVCCPRVSQGGMHTAGNGEVS